ncbi:MAG TPA: cytochrome c3 family protein, partial [Bryobacteraceae bacterium]|nr:cytochrome c3 family protein [Bryobacteraceae bacterium]
MPSKLAPALFLLCWAAGAQTTPAAPAASSAASPSASYVGSETCQPCHEDIYNAFQKNPHKVVDTQKRRGWEARACESCHGPGGKHAESAEAAAIVNPAKLAPADADRACLKCHLNQPTHIGRIESSHAKNEVACTACHSIHRHGPNGLVARRAAAVNEQCASCHTAVWAQFQRPYRHRLPEGAMSCVDCHNPHGSILHASGRAYAANEAGCFRCHGNLRGPFTFEHAPVRLE